MSIGLVSFGYRHGPPAQADLVIDVRFLPNPNFVDELRPLPGTDRAVREYVLQSDETKGFLERFMSLLDYLIPLYEREGKSYLTIAVGCTGGRHRSVFVAHYLADALQGSGYQAVEYHRDISR